MQNQLIYIHTLSLFLLLWPDANDVQLLLWLMRKTNCSSSLWLSLDSTTILQDIFSIPLLLAPNYKNCCKEVDKDNWSRLVRLMVFPI